MADGSCCFCSDTRCCCTNSLSSCMRTMKTLSAVLQPDPSAETHSPARRPLFATSLRIRALSSCTGGMYSAGSVPVSTARRRAKRPKSKTT